jgi:hypothetical protein
MKGIELHRRFFAECGKPLLARVFPDELPLLAAGSFGFGSDRLGADDEVSRDHCWEPGFLLLSDQLAAQRLDEIEAYLFERLPWEFLGFARSDARGSSNGIRVRTINSFFADITTFATPPTRDWQWLLIADEALCHATNGEVFHDPTGDLTQRRAAFSLLPEDVWPFKLAGRAARIDVRRYEAERLVAHGEALSANLSLADGLREVMHFLCLANRRHAPHDRWLPWAARRLPILVESICPLIDRAGAAADARIRLALYEGIVRALADYVFETGLAPKGQDWWQALRQGITGELATFPVPQWVGVEFAYGSQCVLAVAQDWMAKRAAEAAAEGAERAGHTGAIQTGVGGDCHAG